MPEQPSHRLPEEFGGNEWLVDELYERYQQDKNSVDAKWWPLFESFDCRRRHFLQRNLRSSSSCQPDHPSTSAWYRLPRCNSAGRARHRPQHRRRPLPHPLRPTAAAPVKKAPGHRRQGRRAEARKRRRTGSQPIPAQLPKNTKAPTAPEEDVVSVLRGPAKAIATNMVTSLEVPTATSVRAVPAKLLIDNRVVINSNLARARGGKVSFTHLIGYAVIRALSQFPSMNVYYDEVDGKPVPSSPLTSTSASPLTCPSPMARAF